MPIEVFWEPSDAVCIEFREKSSDAVSKVASVPASERSLYKIGA